MMTAYRHSVSLNCAINIISQLMFKNPPTTLIYAYIYPNSTNQKYLNPSLITILDPDAHLWSTHRHTHNTEEKTRKWCPGNRHVRSTEYTMYTIWSTWGEKQLTNDTSRHGGIKNRRPRATGRQLNIWLGKKLLTLYPVTGPYPLLLITTLSMATFFKFLPAGRHLNFSFISWRRKER